MLSEAPLDNTFRFRQVRDHSEHLCAHLSAEDCNLQAIAETSPLKWHLAHTSWFYETFILKPFSPGYRPFHKHFEVLFNSYYNGIGQQHPRSKRHLLSRPGLDEVLAYRKAVDRAMTSLLEHPTACEQPGISERLELGLNHEQQHQELMLTDLKYNFSCNPLLPAYMEDTLPEATAGKGGFEFYKGGLVEIGQDIDEGFSFDNERPRHKTWLEPYALCRNLVTNGEFREFIADGGYRRPELWLSDGWSHIRQEGWTHPLYWSLDGIHPEVFTLRGPRPLRDQDPVCHLSYYEADAFARWAGARLPTEAEWEHACRQSGQSLANMFGQVWQWTSSAYRGYPGYQVAPGAIGEYNGKFMCNQFVLRGSSCATPAGHSRPSYRNFFYPPDRWQFTGLRLASDAMP
ncbi:MAG: ergothioneine biosynthesis protein EgtB [Marinobacter sp.]|jgi:ergothioneine biosynthesis protein EgtB|nr:ergothioneine biosynthesis protein EgtB [Marinobacter sp.]MBC7191451.1 ergothioneine biosynthesis protein EgtB [Marinobacter sp.]